MQLSGGGDGPVDGPFREGQFRRSEHRYLEALRLHGETLLLPAADDGTMPRESVRAGVRPAAVDRRRVKKSVVSFRSRAYPYRRSFGGPKFNGTFRTNGLSPDAAAAVFESRLRM